MNKFVVYTSLVGSYDEIRQPLIIDPRFDYVLFTDNVKENKIGVWQVRPIPSFKGDAMLRSRYVKCLPSKCLSEYDASLYIDANIQIISAKVYDYFVDFYNSGIEWGGVDHPSQGCIYEEICAIVDLKWVHDYNVIDWYGKMKKDGFPDNWGLFENNVVFRRHTQVIERVGKDWWETLQNGCKRDQFSLMYVLWKNQPSMGFFLPKGECPRLNSMDFAYFEHNPHKRVLHLGLFERIRRSILRATATDVRVGYHDLFNRVSKYRCPKVGFYFWNIYAALLFCPIIFYNALKARFR